MYINKTLRNEASHRLNLSYKMIEKHRVTINYENFKVTFWSPYEENKGGI